MTQASNGSKPSNTPSWPGRNSLTVRVKKAKKSRGGAPSLSSGVFARVLAVAGGGRCVVCGATGAAVEVGVGPVYARACDECVGKASWLLRIAKRFAGVK